MNIISFKKALLITLLGINSLTWAIDPATEGALHYDPRMANYGYNDEMRRNGGYNSSRRGSSDFLSSNWGAVTIGLWGAVAVNPQGTLFFIEYQQSESEARQIVLNACHDAKCDVQTYYDSYLAVVESYNKQGDDSYSIAVAPTKEKAEKEAMAYCQQAGHTKCTVIYVKKSSLALDF